MTPEDRRKHRASTRFMLWVIDQAQDAGHVMTDPATWLEPMGHRTGYRSACSCGWIDSERSSTKKASMRHVLQHLGGEVGEHAGAVARMAMSRSNTAYPAAQLEDSINRAQSH